MAEHTEVNSHQGEVNIVNQIADNDRAGAIDAIHDMLFAKASDAMADYKNCLLYTSPSPRDLSTSRMPSSA